VIRYQITDGTIPPSPSADFVQVRNGELGTRELATLVRRVMTQAHRVLVNDRIDVALATGAVGVHLKSNAIAPEQVLRIVPKGFLVTVACHCEDDVLNAVGADYALLSPIFSPRSKADTRQTLGLDELARIARRSPVPILALGGITDANSASCIAAGAAGIAGISLFRQAFEFLDR
jgi:thiamine-phosphate pyrophosphorylase